MGEPLQSRGPRPVVVALGGGHGLSRTLRALRRLDVDATAVVTTADDGGSSGRLRRDLGVTPPGDLRKALSSLTTDPELAALLEYRFPAGELAGHSLGNLLMVALTDLNGGDMVAALDRLGDWLEVAGRVLPATDTPLELIAEGDAGEVRGQLAIARSSGHRRIRLEPSEPPATPQAVAAIDAADLILLGPGSLFTSILPNLAVPGIGTAVTKAAAPLVLIANLREQPGETTGLDLPAHLDVLHDHLPGREIDVLVLHDGPSPHGPGKPLAPITAHPHVRRCVAADLLDGRDGHDPAALAAVFRSLLTV